MSNALTAGKAALVADVKAIAAAHVPGQKVVVMDYEPTSVPAGQVTVTVTASDMRPDALTYRLIIYAPYSDPATGQARQEDVVAAISDELPSRWLDPAWQFGWDDRLNLFVAQATVSTPRGLGS
ncbi:hypothetical protein [Klenkia brasiliensis]|uniref:Uncharacterized protein n=1 Tax=Klenkia brasiliensis TaxID=333142 RepID=A0A1G7YFB4_9ACTN|nr:hypothetical protein [Klenkia brasiliensis]SDG95242.1 hypothetical protein SAMN05660324_3939 [Klenkia brasiliensis]